MATINQVSKAVLKDFDIEGQTHLQVGFPDSEQEGRTVPALECLKQDSNFYALCDALQSQHARATDYSNKRGHEGRAYLMLSMDCLLDDVNERLEQPVTASYVQQNVAKAVGHINYTLTYIKRKQDAAEYRKSMASVCRRYVRPMPEGYLAYNITQASKVVRWSMMLHM
jgi:hypothetical protein